VRLAANPKDETSASRVVTFAGDRNYGGWFYLPTPLSPSSIVYSIGLGENISWDLSIIQKHGCKVWGYDPTPKTTRFIAALQLPDGFIYRAEGIALKPGNLGFSLPLNKNHVSLRAGRTGSGETVVLPVNTLQAWMAQNGHSYIDILKMDVEGMEYVLLENWTGAGSSNKDATLPFNQLLVEFHNRFSKENVSRYTMILRNLEQQGFEILRNVNDQELSFARKTFLPKQALPDI